MARALFLQPMTASIWSTPPSIAFGSFPAITLLRFMHNHHLLQILDRPQWLTIKGGSRNYVRKIIDGARKEQIHHGTNGQGKVVKVERRKGGEQWTLHTADGQSHVFDKVVFATHADTALSILDGQLTGQDPRRTALSAFEFSKNEAVLHSDQRLLPVARSAWAAWNFIAEETPAADADRVSLTYWMNLLQSLPEQKHGPVLVTLNPPTGPAAPRKELIAARYSYEHPVYTSRSVASQQAMKPLQGKDGLYFAGAWLKYGFHEDGFKSGLEAAHAIGARLPFEILAAERDIPGRSIALTAINAVEALRRSVLAPVFMWAAYPIVLVSTFVAGAVLNGGVAQRVRADWQASMSERESRSVWGGKKVD